MNILILIWLAVVAFFVPVLLFDFHVIDKGRALVFVAFWLLSLSLIGAALYGIRTRYRLLYGLLEMLAALCILAGAGIRVASAPYPLSGTSYDWMVFVGQGVLELVVALYVFVRGLDNIGEGLQTYPRLASMWREIFPKPAEVAQTRIGRLETMFWRPDQPKP